MEIEEINFININNKRTLVLFGLKNGFKVFNFFTMECLKFQEFTGGIGPIDCLETSNILALTGGGLFPYFPTNKLIIWDASEVKQDGNRIKAEIIFKEEINNIKFKYEFLFVVCDYKIYIYNLFENLVLKVEIPTSFNSKGRIETNRIDKDSIFAYLSNQEPNKDQAREGVVTVMNLHTDERRTIFAHKSQIRCFKLNVKGNLLVTASIKGTLLRIHNLDGVILKQYRRGIESTHIYCMDINECWLTCITKTGTIHLWKRSIVNELAKKKTGFMSLLSSKEKNYALLKIEPMKNASIIIDVDNKIKLFSYDGQYMEVQLDDKKLKIINTKNIIDFS